MENKSADNKNLKTMLAIGGWNEGSSRFSPMVADPGRRREFVKNSVKFLRQNHFDGLDLDWEYPAFRDGGKPRDKDNYASAKELSEEFDREASKTGRPRLLLSMAMPAGIEYIDKGYDVPKLNEYLDFINLLSYDYHSAYEPAVNHHSPLYPLEEDNEYKGLHDQTPAEKGGLPGEDHPRHTDVRQIVHALQRRRDRSWIARGRSRSRRRCDSRERIPRLL